MRTLHASTLDDDNANDNAGAVIIMLQCCIVDWMVGGMTQAILCYKTNIGPTEGGGYPPSGSGSGF